MKLRLLHEIRALEEVAGVSFDKVSKKGLQAATVSWLVKHKGDWWGNKPITSEMVKELEPFRLEAPMTLYRGFSDEGGELEYRRSGEKFEYRSNRYPESWTKNKKIAWNFARGGSYGFVVERVFSPDETVVDFSMLPSEVTKKLINMHEEEVLLKPNLGVLKVKVSRFK